MKRKLFIALGVLIVSGLVFAAVETKFYGNINMQNNKILNVATDNSTSSATTKGYVDTAISGLSSVYLPRTGGTMSGTIYMGSTHQIKNLADPTASQDATTKSYVDTQTHTRLNKQGGQLFGTLDLQTNYIVRVHGPRSGSVGDLDAVNKYYVNNTFLPLTGGNLSGRLNMGGSYIDNVATPTNATQAATKGYVDSADLTKLNLSGGTMSGAIDMNGQKITRLGYPTSSADGASKSYVDYVISQAANSYGSFDFFALRKGSAYPPIVNIDHYDNTNLTFVVLKEFYGKIVANGENINAVVSASDSSVKTWKVGESFSVSFLPIQEPTTATNGSIIVSLEKDETTLSQSNFGITFVPSGGVPVPELSVGVDGTTYAPNTSANVSSAMTELRTITFQLTNTSLADVEDGKIYFDVIREYDRDATCGGTITIMGTSYGTQEEISLPSMPSGGVGVNAVVTISSFDSNHGLRMNFYLKYGGNVYNYGQFFIPNAE